MTVTINGMSVTVFAGAQVRDAVRRLSPALLLQIETGAARVHDSRGWQVELDGALAGGETLFVATQGGDT
jgi:hypothetical protein